MFNFPVDTFWYIVPWPFIWLALSIVMYFVKNRDDKLEEDQEEEMNKHEI